MRELTVNELARLVASMPTTKDGVKAYAGMPLSREGLDDQVMSCYVDVRAVWIGKNGHTFVDDVENFNSAEPTNDD